MTLNDLIEGFNDDFFFFHYQVEIAEAILQRVDPLIEQERRIRRRISCSASGIPTIHESGAGNWDSIPLVPNEENATK